MDDQTMILEDGTEVLLIHFLCCGKIVCTPNSGDMAATPLRSYPLNRTEEIVAVTCPLCKRTEKFIQAAHSYQVKQKPKKVVY